MENCLFCKIARKEINSQVVFEDDSIIAFLDIHPVTPGHTLVIPKDHYNWFQEVPEELGGKLFARAQAIARDLKQEKGADFIELSIVGVDVPHTHIHLIPR